MSLTRRAMLRYGLFGAIALTLVSRFECTSASRSKPDPNLALQPRHVDLLVVLLPHLVPAVRGFPDPTSLDLVDEIDRFLTRSSEGLRAEFGQLLDVFDSPLAGLLFDAQPVRFRHASTAQRDRRLDRWRTSRLTLRRKGFRALQTLCGALYYSHSNVRAAIGYSGPPAVSAFADQHDER